MTDWWQYREGTSNAVVTWPPLCAPQRYAACRIIYGLGSCTVHSRPRASSSVTPLPCQLYSARMHAPRRTSCRIACSSAVRIRYRSQSSSIIRREVVIEGRRPVLAQIFLHDAEARNMAPDRRLQGALAPPAVAFRGSDR